MMDFDALLRQLQDWTNKVPLLILGSGTSVPFGLPSMWNLGEHLKNTLSFDKRYRQRRTVPYKI